MAWMQAIMTWFQVAFGGAMMLGLVMLIWDEVRSRLTEPKGSSPLAGMGFWDILLTAGYILPLIAGYWMLIQNVLT